MRHLRSNVVLACIGAMLPAMSSLAVDLSVAAIEVTQGLQSAAGDLPLVARNATLVRVTVSLNGGNAAVAGVDAVLRIYANGIEIPESPVYSSNGPIAAPVAPTSANANDTINFHCLPPEGADIDFVVTVNPFGTVAETNIANNSLALENRAFVCRRMMDLAYVPVNYTPGGGSPNAAMIEPGSGDAFLRAIYKTGDWNYHRSPLPPLTHPYDINISNILLLNTLNDIRQNQIPAAGYARPDFIYGWLPGNPFPGNGQAIGTPGAAAFGNTDPLRFQRTFAHEIGHCWGQPHNQLFSSSVGWDVEHHLRDPLGLAAIMPASKRDVMVAGLNTPDAWVAPLTYLDAIQDARSACTALAGQDPGAGSGPADDAVRVLRIAGVHDHLMRRVDLAPAMVHEHAPVTADDPRGNTLVEAFAADGTRLHAVRIDTRTCRESCAEPGHMHRATSLYVNLPEREADRGGGRGIARVLVRELRGGAPGRPLAEMRRSAHAPVITALEITAREITAREVIGVDSGTGARGPSEATSPDDIGRASRLEGRVRATWRTSDADGDRVVADLLYSPDGGHAWFPLSLGNADGSFEFDTADIPASRGALGRFDLRVSDGLHTARTSATGAGAGDDAGSGGGSWFVGNSQPPDVHLLTPNQSDTVLQGATVILHASAWDIDEQLIPDAQVTWTSSRDGPIGSGRLLSRRNLTSGTHVLTVRGTDSGGLFAERSVTITVQPRIYNNGNIDGEGVVGSTDIVSLLSDWGLTGLGDMDLDGIVGPRDITLLIERWGQ